MSKRPFVIFGIFVAVLAVVIPLLAFNSSGNPDKGPRSVPSDLSKGKTLFVTNCGTCHTLYAAGTDGNFAPTSTSCSRPPAPDRPHGEADDHGHQGQGPERDPQRRRQRHPGPDAGRDPQPAARPTRWRISSPT